MRSRGYYFWLAVSCPGLGSLPGALEWLFGGASPRQALWSALFGCIYAVCIAIPCGLAIPRTVNALRDRSIQLRVIVTMAALAVFGTAGCFVANVILLALHLIRPGAFESHYFNALATCLIITFTFGMLSLAITTLQQRLASTRRELDLRQMAEERERKIAAEARYASLESRVQPHFLFNTLNSISALVREDPAEAERMIERLAALLRFSLDSELSGLVPLEDELRIVREYLEIEKVRFGARLRYRIHADPAAGALSVPALSIQTLVENSVKYAVGARREGAEIVVSATIREGRLRVEVEDDGPGFEPARSHKPGHGLDLLERRLAALFGADASLEISTRPGHTGVAVCVLTAV